MDRNEWQKEERYSTPTTPQRHASNSAQEQQQQQPPHQFRHQQFEDDGMSKIVSPSAAPSQHHFPQAAHHQHPHQQMHSSPQQAQPQPPQLQQHHDSLASYGGLQHLQQPAGPSSQQYTPFVIPNWMPQDNRSLNDAYAQWQQQQAQAYYQPYQQQQQSYSPGQAQNGYHYADQQAYYRQQQQPQQQQPYQQYPTASTSSYKYSYDMRPSTATPPFDGNSHESGETFDRLSRSAPASASLSNAGNFPLLPDVDQDDEGEYAGGPARKKRNPPKDAAARKYVCEECSQRFARPSALATHILTHTKEKPFKCLTCDRAFGVMSNLRRHCRVRNHVPADKPPPLPSQQGAIMRSRTT